MTTLPANEIIPDGAAKRLSVQFGLTWFFQTGAIHLPEDPQMATTRINDARDPQGFEADRRALIDYLKHHGPRTPVEDWERLRPDWDAVVPWSYGR